MKYSTLKCTRPCNCRSVGECSHNLFSWKIALEKMVNDFASQMKKQLIRKALEGKSGWDDPNWPMEDIIAELRNHIEKGDMVDVANFAVFAWNRNL